MPQILVDDDYFRFSL